MGLTIEKIKSEASRVSVPARALGDVFLETTEKISSQQFKSYQAYTSIYFSQLKKLPDIQNLEDAGSFFWDQIEPISEFNKQMLNDWKTMVGLNTDFFSDAKAAIAPAKKPESKPQKTEAKKSTPKKSTQPKTDSSTPAAAATTTTQKATAVTKIPKSKSATPRKTTSSSSTRS